MVMIKEDHHESTKNPMNMMIMTMRWGFNSNNLHNMMMVTIKWGLHQSTNERDNQVKRRLLQPWKHDNGDDQMKILVLVVQILARKMKKTKMDTTSTRFAKRRIETTKNTIELPTLRRTWTKKKDKHLKICLVRNKRMMFINNIMFTPKRWNTQTRKFIRLLLV
jgi:hypothetical protein